MYNRSKLSTNMNSETRTQITEKLNHFFSSFPSKIYKKGEEIQVQKNGIGNILYLKKGLVKMYAVSLSGEELVLNIFKPGTFFPMLSLFNEEQNDPYYFHIALEDAELYIAPRPEVEAFLKEEKEIMWDLISRVFRGMDGMLQRVIQFMTGDAYSKIVAHLLLIAKRFGNVGDNNVTITLPLTHQELANHAGLSRETVSRQMKILERDGLLHYKKNIIVIDNIEKLENLLVVHDTK